LGGNGMENDIGGAIAVDASGNAYVAGHTNSINFPTTLGAFQPVFGGGLWDAFVTKLDSTGSALVYSSYLGGSGYEVGWAIAVDAGGNAYVTGETSSSDFPTTPGAANTSFLGFFQDAFVAKIVDSGADTTPPTTAAIASPGA